MQEATTNEEIMFSRRDFLEKGSGILSFLTLANPFGLKAWTPYAPQKPLSVHVFSKHLQFLGYSEMASIAKDMGFDGVELTVRKGGHVLPENVVRDLPKAVQAIQQAGLDCQMMVTGITSLNTESRTVISTAADLGISYYRMGYYRYPEDLDMPAALAKFKEQVSELSKLNEELGVKGSYQNHAGTAVGSSIWEIWQLVDNIPAESVGCQYDIRHAVVEGGASWENGLRLIKSRIHSLVLKDFKWKKINGRWEILNTPIGEGMVDFKAYFRLLKKYGIKVPVSMHFEYDLEGAEHGERNLSINSRKKVFEAMQRDLEIVRQLWEEA